MENSQTQNDKKMLVVDDEPDIIESLEELLEDTFVVAAASTFEEAASCLKNNTYDVAILDIMGVRGYDLLEATQFGDPDPDADGPRTQPGQSEEINRAGRRCVYTQKSNG